MPRLLSVNNYYYRRDGSEVVYFDHNRMLEAAGWDIVPFAMHHPANKPSEWSKYFVDEIEFGQDYSLFEKLQRLPKIIYSFEAQRKIGELIENTKPDICHCHTIYHHISPSILSRLKQAGLPVIMTLHDLKLACPAYHMHNKNGVCEDCRHGGLQSVVKNKCVKNSSALSLVSLTEAVVHRWLKSYKNCVDIFVSPCQFYIDKLVEWGWDRQQFIHIPNGVAPSDYAPQFDKHDDYLLYFGRLSPEKGLPTFIKAAAKSGVAIAFAGDGPQRDELQILARELKCKSRFFGHLSGEQLEKAVQNAKATVLPAEWYENAPMSVLESYAMGKPVIGARIGGIPEQVIDGETGRLFTSGSIDELASCLSEYANMSAEDISRQGRAAHQHLQSHFSLDLYSQRIQELYAKVLGTQRHAIPYNA